VITPSEPYLAVASLKPEIFEKFAERGEAYKKYARAEDVQGPLGFE
jgi:hypothetical protein